MHYNFISTKIGKVGGVHDVIIHCNFGFNIFRGFRSTGGQNFRFPIDFAGHCYNSAAATAWPVMCLYLSLHVCVKESSDRLRSERARNTDVIITVDELSTLMRRQLHQLRQLNTQNELLNVSH